MILALKKRAHALLSRLARRLLGRLHPGQNLFVLDGDGLEAFRATGVYQGVFTTHHVGHLHQGEFERAFEAAYVETPAAVDRETLRYRTYTASSLARQASALEGGFLCIGVAWGVLARTVMNCAWFAGSGKAMWLVDAWEGVFAYGEEARRSLDIYPDSVEPVQGLFSGYPKARLIQGRAPEVLDRVAAERFCFIHLDIADPVIEPDIIRAAVPLMTPGGVLVVDNYGLRGGRPDAFDAVFRELGLTPLVLLNGQAVVFIPRD